MQTNNTPTTPTTAVVVWNGDTEAKVKAIINAGGAVPQALVKVAPKGFISQARTARRNELYTNSESVLGQIAQKGFRLVKCGEVKTLKDGRQQVAMEMELRPVRKLTAEEAAATFGLSPEIAKLVAKAASGTLTPAEIAALS